MRKPMNPNPTPPLAETLRCRGMKSESLATLRTLKTKASESKQAWYDAPMGDEKLRLYSPMATARTELDEALRKYADALLTAAEQSETLRAENERLRALIETLSDALGKITWAEDLTDAQGIASEALAAYTAYTETP